MILVLIFSGDLRGGFRSWDRNFLCSCSVFYWEVGCEGSCAGGRIVGMW